MVMIYFSGTGNSKYIAESYCRIMGATCHSIETDIDFSRVIAAENTIGFCYPVYGSRVPRIMREFTLKHIESLKNKKLIIFCTQMLFSGDGARAFTDMFPRDYLNVIYAEHFLMPNNVCNLFITPLDSKKRIERYLSNADKKMKRVCEDIQNGITRKRGFNPLSRFLGLFQGVPYPVLEKSGRSKVWIGNECNKCQLCTSICPMKNLSFINGEIIPENNCTMCYRCINKCPQMAISVFIRGKVRKQYKGV